MQRLHAQTPAEDGGELVAADPVEQDAVVEKKLRTGVGAALRLRAFQAEFVAADLPLAVEHRLAPQVVGCRLGLGR